MKCVCRWLKGVQCEVCFIYWQHNVCLYQMNFKKKQKMYSVILFSSNASIKCLRVDRSLISRMQLNFIITSTNLHQLPPSSKIHSILHVQFTCLTVVSTTSIQVIIGLPLALEPSTSYAIHFFTQSLSSFHNMCPYHRNLFCCSTEIVSSILISLSTPYWELIMSHIHLTILITAC